MFGSRLALMDDGPTAQWRNMMLLDCVSQKYQYGVCYALSGTASLEESS